MAPPSTSMVMRDGGLDAAGDLLDGGHLGAAADPAADRHRAREADLAGAVVDAQPTPPAPAASSGQEAVGQRQGEVAVGDRPAERALGVGPLHVDVDPLVVAGGLGEQVDLRLGDLDPVASSPGGCRWRRAARRGCVNTVAMRCVPRPAGSRPTRPRRSCRWSSRWPGRPSRWRSPTARPPGRRPRAAVSSSSSSSVVTLARNGCMARLGATALTRTPCGAASMAAAPGEGHHARPWPRRSGPGRPGPASRAPTRC